MERDEIPNICTFQEYLKIRHEVPYIYDVSFSNRSLRYFGVNHVYEHTSALFPLLKSEIQAFHPDLILVEGCEPLRRVHPKEERKAFLQAYSQKSEMEAIHEFGEAGYAILEALSGGIDVLCAEPSFSDEVQNLLKRGYDKKVLFLYYIYRTLPHWLEIGQAPEFEEYAKRDIQMMVETGLWSRGECTLEEVERLSHEMWGGGIPFDDRRALDLRFWPSYFGGEGIPSTAVNDAARASVYFRDHFIVSEICTALEEHQRIFVVYGSQHAVFQERSLKALARRFGADTEGMKEAWQRVCEQT